MIECAYHDLFNEGNDKLISAFIDYNEAGYHEDDSDDEVKMELLRTIRSLDIQRRRKILNDLIRENSND